MLASAFCLRALCFIKRRPLSHMYRGCFSSTTCNEGATMDLPARYRSISAACFNELPHVHAHAWPPRCPGAGSKSCSARSHAHIPGHPPCGSPSWLPDKSTYAMQPESCTAGSRCSESFKGADLALLTLCTFGAAKCAQLPQASLELQLFLRMSTTTAEPLPVVLQSSLPGCHPMQGKRRLYLCLFFLLCSLLTLERFLDLFLSPLLLG